LISTREINIIPKAGPKVIPKTKKSSIKAKAVPLFVLGTDSAIIEKKEGH